MSEAKRSHDQSWPARRDAAAAQGAGKLAAFLNKTPPRNSGAKIGSRAAAVARTYGFVFPNFRLRTWCSDEFRVGPSFSFGTKAEVGSRPLVTLQSTSWRELVSAG